MLVLRCNQEYTLSYGRTIIFRGAASPGANRCQTDATRVSRAVRRSSSDHRTIEELGTREPTWGTVQLLAHALGVSCEAFNDSTLQPPADTEPARPRGRPRKTGTDGSVGQAETKATPKGKASGTKKKGK